jgi:bifunctional ADP-heptose synthase (sugar kinase/adenylyltransferase)
VGGELRFTSGITFSSSSLLNQHVQLLPPEVAAWLDQFRARHPVDEVREYLDGLRSMRVPVVGAAILDEYVYCDALGKSAKEPILALRYLFDETHAGGGLAIANHLADFCGQVDLVTYLGATNPREEFVRSQLKGKVNPIFIHKAGSPTIVKRRFVETYQVSKVLEVYEINDAPLAPAEEDELCEALEARLAECDLAIAADFGHGLITPRARELLCNKARYLAVNTQMNAANAGFHTMSKYRHADYVCVHEGEVRLDSRDRTGDLHALVADLAKRLMCGTTMVTRGKHGTLLYREAEGFSSCPSFAVRVLDRLGAGDAVLAITALCAARRLPADVVGFIANVVGAQAVTIVGNSASIDRVSVVKSVEALLK